ncbi:solute carrier family 49 member 4 homolog isoform X2 [Tubulanus polymorphus]|uniref:solute carrier family 49 member 4 homolog isoform X2 n=1 Tax=Tubulanus polymorphus TaxID=672921 RepID=UPI003DA2FC56
METEPLLPRELRVVPGGPGSDDHDDGTSRSVDFEGSHRERTNTYADVLRNKDIRNQTEVKVYGRRWYILFMFSLLGLGQGCVWNSFGPISQSIKDVFGWQDSTIALSTNWACITYVLSSVFFSWLLEVKGLRVSVILTSALLVVGCGIKCISKWDPYFTWLAHLGCIVSGFAGPVVMAGPPCVSATWFPANGRTTATAIMIVSNYLGVALSFILGPLIVNTHTTYNNITTPTPNISYISSDIFIDFSNTSNVTVAPPTLAPSKDNESIEAQRAEIMILLYIEEAFHVIVFICILIYFPPHPPLPPTISASTDRVSFIRGLGQAFCHARLWVMAIPYGLGLGVYNCWNAILDVNLSPLGIQQSEAGWLGFYAVMAGCTGALIVSWISDHFLGHMKIFCIVLFIGAGGSALWSMLLIGQYIPFNSGELYTSIIVGGLLIYTCIALFFEMACESAYPIAESVISGMFALLNNICGVTFLLLFYIPNIGTEWMNWCFIMNSCSIFIMF